MFQFLPFSSQIIIFACDYISLKILDMRYVLLVVFSSLLLIYCAGPVEERSTSVGSDGWLRGVTDEKFEIVAGQFGGFARSMMDVHHRYVEMYWAGEDENWQYAEYQLDEMRKSIEDGFERRPARAASGQHFMDVVIPEMANAIAEEDKQIFDEAFELMTLQCNSCHAMEQVAFIQIHKPEVRTGAVMRR
ncbi:MAG: hypothetical protein EA411_07095 [Saprospirales bacterium]|nr:MAG: hypothetical protein EA411_07095 [Saprospirales bacterium]